MALAAAPGCGFNSSAAKPGADAGDDAPGGGDGGSVDTPSGTGFCYGPPGWQVCLDAAPTGMVTLSGMIDSDKSDANDPCLKAQPSGWTDTQPAACVIAFDKVKVMSVAVTGNRPLVIVAQTLIDVGGLLDVASHRTPLAMGAGAASAGDCEAFGGNPGSGPPGGGGAGGSFRFPGGDGGTGDGVNQQGGQAAGAGVGAPTRLRGGCQGQPGAGGKDSDGGVGGGAVYLVSAGTISISGKIDVSGAGGAGQDALHGGGGGGSGGTIILYAPSITTTPTTILIANGGGGGGGSAQSGLTMKGDDGHEPTLAIPIVPALGGPGGVLVAADGGDGGAGYPATTVAVPPLNLKGAAGDTGAAGGGGGGGGGYIRSNQDLGTAAVSPAVDLKPSS